MLMLLGSMVYSVSAMDIESQILKIRSADDDNRYKLVNELKRELSKLGRVERTHAILALKQQMTTSVKSTAVAASNVSAANIKQNQQNGQHNILDNYHNIAAVDTAMISATQSKGGSAGAEVLNNTNTVQIVTSQVTPSPPADSIASILPQNSAVQQAIAPINPIVNNVASTLPRAVIMRHSMRMISYRI